MIYVFYTWLLTISGPAEKKMEWSFTYDLQQQYILTIEIVLSFDIIRRNVAKKSNGN